MAKNKGKKKSKGKNPKGASSSSSAHAADPGTSSVAVDATNETQPIWSIADECDHYAALGCHIANIARCKPPYKSSNSNSKQHKRSMHGRTASNSNGYYTCSEYDEMYNLAMQQHPWLLGMERFDPSEYHPEDIANIPEVAMNDGDDEGDECMTLTLTNVTNTTTNICFVTVYDVDVCDANGCILTSGTASIITTDDKSTTATLEERKCTTFIVLCPPQTFVHLCALAPHQSTQSSSSSSSSSNNNDEKMPITSWSQIDIESDVQPWSSHSNIDDAHPYLLHFPFNPIDTESTTNGEAETETTTTTPKTYYRCTQSENGQLTHFFHGNYHAIDFACPIGTPLYSPANGVVVDVRDKNFVVVEGGNEAEEASGIAARNLFHWNSVMIRVEEEEAEARSRESETTTTTSMSKNERGEDSLYIEFVHIRTGSCEVEAGDAVRKGQLLCKSGSVGFSPEPHLHLAAYRSNGNDAATVRVRFESASPRNARYDEDAAENSNKEDTETVQSFLPRAGGWYNQNGLVTK